MIIARNGDIAIRKIKESDLHMMVKYADNEKVSINLRDAFPNPYTYNDALNFYSLVQQHPESILAIEYQGKYAGNISLIKGSDVYCNSAEIGYFIGEPFWNKGIATKAVSLMIEYGFRHLQIIRIFTGVYEFNKASQRVLEKCGFEKEAILKNSITKKGNIYDEIRYAIINPEYK